MFVLEYTNFIWRFFWWVRLLLYVLYCLVIFGLLVVHCFLYRVFLFWGFWNTEHPFSRALEAFHIWCFQTILHLPWWDKTHHVEICHRAGTTCLEAMLLRRQLRCLSHVIRMLRNRLRRLRYSDLPTADARWDIRLSFSRTTVSVP